MNNVEIMSNMMHNIRSWYGVRYMDVINWEYKAEKTIKLFQQLRDIICDEMYFS